MKCKRQIASIRLYYDKKFDESDPTWWKRIRDSMGTKVLDYYKDNYNKESHKGIVVKYR